MLQNIDEPIIIKIFDYLGSKDKLSLAATCNKLLQIHDNNIQHKIRQIKHLRKKAKKDIIKKYEYNNQLHLNIQWHIIQELAQDKINKLKKITLEAYKYNNEELKNIFTQLRIHNYVIQMDKDDTTFIRVSAKTMKYYAQKDTPIKRTLLFLHSLPPYVETKTSANWFQSIDSINKLSFERPITKNGRQTKSNINLSNIESKKPLFNKKLLVPHLRKKLSHSYIFYKLQNIQIIHDYIN